ncbi:reverse transcriptase domain-containing protein [Tanacetum coccineum]
MAPTMTTRNAGRRTAATRDRRTGGQTGRGGIDERRVMSKQRNAEVGNRVLESLYVTEPPTIQNAILKAGVLTDETVRNGSFKRTSERSEDGGELSKEGNVKGNNKRARTGKVFATITNPVRKEYTCSAPKCTNCNFHYNLETPYRTCTNCNHLGYFAKDCMAGPKMVNPLNAKNPTAARGACYECGGTDHYKAPCPRMNRAPGQ